MRILPALLLLAFLAPAQAFEWRNDIYHCSASLPDSTGWQPIVAPPTPGIEPLIVMQNSAKQALFGINIVAKVPGTRIAEPAVQQSFEGLLRGFGYQFFGHSTMNVGGIEWLQYQVRSGAGAQQVAGVVRFAAAGGYFFSITLLRGGGREAAQDVELQHAAASFRILPGAPSPAQVIRDAAPVPAPAEEKRESQTPAATEEAAATDHANLRMIWCGGAGIIVLLVLVKIIAGGGASKKS